ncbi:MAG: hypothetical protein ABL871_03825 [Terricaulis sp.]
MAVYLISYDLRAPGRDYTSLYAELARIQAAKLTLSDWIVELNQTPIQVRNVMKTYVDENDRIAVLQIVDWATWNGMAGGVALLRRLLT